LNKNSHPTLWLLIYGFGIMAFGIFLFVIGSGIRVFLIFIIIGLSLIALWLYFDARSKNQNKNKS
jgi:Flp pilus assembly protein TadB